MTNTEKDKLIDEFLQKLVDMKDDPVWKQGTQFTNNLMEIINKVEECAKVEGFQEGFQECKKQYEKKLGKLN